MRRLPLLWPAFLLLALLAGCQQGLIKGTDDDTGELGSVKKGGSPADTYVQLAAEYLRLGDYQSALTKAKKAVMKDSGNANAYLVLGLVYEALNEIDQAQAAYRKARAVDDRNPYVLNAYGRLLCQLEEYENSFRAFEKAVQNPLY
jgi:type IV pilus biogenesis/stability protein PilW